MKKILFSVLVLSLVLLANSFAYTSINSIPQDTVQVSLEDLEVEDSVSVDDMDPVFYTPELEEEEGLETEDSEKSNLLVYVIFGVVVVAGGIIFYTRSKKK